MDERGSISILVAALSVMLVGAAMGGLKVVEASALRQAARTAADATALAAAVHPEQADAVASANGATIVGSARGPGWVEVEVERKGARSRARAQVPPGPVGVRGANGLDLGIVEALGRAEALVGRPIPIVSGYRSHEQQMALWAARGANPYPVAAPGTSKHEQGLAVDLSVSDAALVESLRVGLCRPYANDPVHMELC